MYETLVHVTTAELRLIMNWTTIHSGTRTGTKAGDGPRTEYQRDFDRLIFSSGFRRLQNKTQVFPLPGSTFVHNRLTHSLEVASVGRSLGSLVGTRISNENHLNGIDEIFYKYELPNVIASACLAHDIGNPAFGHSGEKAIARYFSKNENLETNNKKLIEHFSKEEWTDFVKFEGNANGFRILTNHFKGKSPGGYGLTYSTLAAVLKYPCESIVADQKSQQKHKTKFGVFQSEKEVFQKIAQKLGLKQESNSPLCFGRHPFVYLTEAADDICYSIIDFEDAHRLSILSHDEVINSFKYLIECLNRPESKFESVVNTLGKIEDPNEQISYLRAKCINALAHESADVFMSHSSDIIKCNYGNNLIDEIEGKCHALKEIKAISEKKIYNHQTVIEIELAGYNIMSELLTLFIPAVLSDNKDHRDKKLLNLLPSQFVATVDKPYYKVLSILDYISGMTDGYAIELYKKLVGIDIPKHK